MTTMITEVYDALVDAGASEEKARKAATAVADYADRMHGIERQVDRIDGRMNTLTWMVGTNITLTLLVLGKLFIAH